MTYTSQKIRGYKFTRKDIYSKKQRPATRKTDTPCDVCGKGIKPGGTYYDVDPDMRYNCVADRNVRNIGALFGKYFCSVKCVEADVIKETGYSIKELNEQATAALKDYEE